MLERQTERQEAERVRLGRDHEETLQRHKTEMQKTMERELERKIASENRRHQELMMNWRREEAARQEARVRQMQNNMDRKVSNIEE